MNKLGSVLATGVVGLAVLAAAGTTLIRLAHALVPVVLVGGIVAGVLRVLWFYTRRW
jgi:hypothetical protein